MAGRCEILSLCINGLGPPRGGGVQVEAFSSLLGGGIVGEFRVSEIDVSVPGLSGSIVQWNMNCSRKT